MNGHEVLRRGLKDRYSKWTRATPPRIAAAPVAVDVRPKFKLDHRGRFFCIGSCFARNVEEHLTYAGAQVLSRRLIAPAEERDGGRAAGLVNKYTCRSMAVEVQWAADPRSVPSGVLFEDGEDGWIDGQLAGNKRVTRERAIERRRYMSGDYFARVFEADTLILTLGLDELWFDRKTQLPLNGGPPKALVATDPERFELRVARYDAELTALEKLLALVVERNPEVKLIVTVSPVSLKATFSGLDVLQANMRSKSLLRTVAQAFADRNPQVAYFPSYEMVTLAPSDQAFSEDGRHVRDGVVEQVIGAFFRTYCDVVVAPPEGYSELGYLAANPDVDDMIRRGELGSGYEHWITSGQAEGRPMQPADSPTRRMRKLGAG